jgi:hypothetical protein
MTTMTREEVEAVRAKFHRRFPSAVRSYVPNRSFYRSEPHCSAWKGYLAAHESLHPSPADAKVGAVEVTDAEPHEIRRALIDAPKFRDQVRDTYQRAVKGEEQADKLAAALQSLLGCLGPGGYFSSVGKTKTDAARAALEAYEAQRGKGR